MAVLLGLKAFRPISRPLFSIQAKIIINKTCVSSLTGARIKIPTLTGARIKMSSSSLHGLLTRRLENSAFGGS